MSDSEGESANEGDLEVCKKRKKGVRRPMSYKVNRIKKARIHGYEYVNYKRTHCGSPENRNALHVSRLMLYLNSRCLTGVYCLKAVSYTHLDVYKRQGDDEANSH